MHSLLEALEPFAASDGPALARSAYAMGLAVTRPDGSTRPIPITATPVVAERRQVQELAELSARLSSAAVKMARAVLGSEDRELLAGALSPLERKLAELTYRAPRFATTRVDYFVRATDGRAAALEINATIPAMHGYSDIAAEAFIRWLGGHANLPVSTITELSRRNGSNANALYRALLDGFALDCRRAPDRIGLLCRRNDAQLPELRFLAKRFAELGTEADVLFPDELSGDESVLARGKRYELIYRHLFVRRLEESPAPYVAALLAECPPRRAVVLNPPASQIEVKTTFALLSQAGQEPSLAERAGLDADELRAARDAIPWTRLFRRGPAKDEEGAPTADLVSFVASHPERFVLKRAWEYGGKAVFIGASAKDDSFSDRARAAFGAALSWSELCQRAADDRVGGGFVVQAMVDAAPQTHLLCTEAGLSAQQLFVDFSAYASVGLTRSPEWGGVCRGSPSHVVNIVGGGGVLPLLTTEVADALLSALKARRPGTKGAGAL